MLNFEGNVPFHIQCDYFDVVERLSPLFVVFGRNAFVEIFEDVVRVVVLQIVEHHGNVKSALDLDVAAVT